MKKIILPDGFGKPTYEELIDFVTSPDNDSATFEEKIIAMFLRDYRPADGTEKERCDLTSIEIQTRLEDIAPVPLEDIAMMMVDFGYQLVSGVCGDLCWRMRCVNPAPEE